MKTPADDLLSPRHWQWHMAVCADVLPLAGVGRGSRRFIAPFLIRTHAPMLLERTYMNVRPRGITTLSARRTPLGRRTPFPSRKTLTPTPWTPPPSQPSTLSRCTYSVSQPSCGRRLKHGPRADTPAGAMTGLVHWYVPPTLATPVSLCRLTASDSARPHARSRHPAVHRPLAELARAWGLACTVLWVPICSGSCLASC